MKLILVSDLHLVEPGTCLFGRDPLVQLEACIRHINQRHADADLVVFAGDLANDREPPAYAALSERIGDLAPPYRLMMGNHDDRDAFRAAFPNTPMEDGFVQSWIDIGHTRVILLDTLWPEHVGGLLCDTRIAWLEAVLAPAREALVFMHHPPFPIGIPSLDACGLTDADTLLSVLQKHGNVRHIFAGHVHRLSSGSWHGIPFTTVRGTNHQSALKLVGSHELSFEAPSYAVVLVSGDVVAVHTEEFPTEP